MRRYIFIATALFALCTANGLKAQTKLRLGLNLGGTISRVAGDTMPKNFSRRNRIGVGFGLTGQYDLRKFASIQFGVNYIGKGYKVNNDTLNTSVSVIHRVNTINIPLGLVFRQGFNSSNYIQEKFGFAGSFSLGKDSVTTNNNSSNTKFRITEIRQNNFYPMFYLGFGLGGNTESGDRYEFGVNYYQSFAKDAYLRVDHSANLAKHFPLNYRGGFLFIGFSYYFNLSNFKKASDYFE